MSHSPFDNGFGPQYPGSVSGHDLDAEDETPPAAPSLSEGLELNHDYAAATFRSTGGIPMSDDEVADIHSREHICASCYHRHICRYAPRDPEIVIVVSRCAAYEPS